MCSQPIIKFSKNIESPSASSFDPQIRPQLTTGVATKLDPDISLPWATLSLDLDNKWAYLRAHNDPAWKGLPSYLKRVVPRILEILDKFQQKITFFVVGQDAMISDHRQVLREIADRGHEIANHSFHHEPQLHRYTPDRLEQEFQWSESAIANVTGQKTVGFRGPGFSISDSTLKSLIDRGYFYDSTIFPTFIGPLARAYYFRHGRFSPEQRRDRQALFGRFRDGFLPNRSFIWKFEQGHLLEIPVSTFVGLKVPIHATYLHYLAGFSPWVARQYFRTALSIYRLSSLTPSILLHPLDFLGVDDEPELCFFPGMKMKSAEKLTQMEQYLSILVQHFNVVPLQRYAQAVIDSPLPKRSIGMARPGVS